MKEKKIYRRIVSIFKPNKSCLSAEEIYAKINSFLQSHNAHITSFEYYPKIFGNMIVNIAYNGTELEFVVDRGEIYCNKKCICDGSYHVAGRDDAIDKLIEVIQEKMLRDKL